MTRAEIIAKRIAEMRHHIDVGFHDLAHREFAHAIYAAFATPGCEAQGARLQDLPRLAEMVAGMGDRVEALVAERDEARAEANTLHIELSNVRESYANSTRRHADLQRLLNDNTSDLPASVRNRVIPGSCVTDEAGRLLVSVAVERDALRAQLAEAKTLGASLHKASAAGYDRCTGDVVAFLRKHAAGMVLVNQHDNVRLRGTCYLNAANMIERAEHVGAKERE